MSGSVGDPAETGTDVPCDAVGEGAAAAGRRGAGRCDAAGGLPPRAAGTNMYTPRPARTTTIRPKTAFRWRADRSMPGPGYFRRLIGRSQNGAADSGSSGLPASGPAAPPLRPAGRAGACDWRPAEESAQGPLGRPGALGRPGSRGTAAGAGRDGRGVTPGRHGDLGPAGGGGAGARAGLAGAGPAAADLGGAGPAAADLGGAGLAGAGAAGAALAGARLAG